MSIEVHVRVRPNVPDSVWSSAETVLYSPLNAAARFVYNRVHPASCTNATLFQGIEAVVHAAFDGKNVTVMAYGQTGSGKTHSMVGTRADPGLIPRVAHLLHSLRQQHPGTTLSAFYTEVYNESVRDLLEPERGELTLHEAADGSVYYDKRAIQLVSEEHFMELQAQAERNRKYGVTNLNDHSSRSHIILTIEIRRPNRGAGRSVLNLVDLAGSESAVRANTEGLSLREGGFINRSLLTLGNVVDAIVEKRPYVPYRDAKLTRILRNCLGGSGITFIVCCVNPSRENYDQTVATLRFTQRAMKIKNDPIVVVSMPPLFTFQLSSELESKRDEMKALCDDEHNRGLYDTYMYCKNTLQAVIAEYKGHVGDSILAMAQLQRMLLAHEHARGISRISQCSQHYRDLRSRREQLLHAIGAERKRHRDAQDLMMAKQQQLLDAEAAYQSGKTEAEVRQAEWEYRLAMAQKRRISTEELLFAQERAQRQRIQYQWVLGVERSASRMVPMMKAIWNVPDVEDRNAVMKARQQERAQRKAELIDLEGAHAMIRDELPHDPDTGVQAGEQGIDQHLRGLPSTTRYAPSSDFGASSLLSPSPQPQCPYTASADTFPPESHAECSLEELAGRIALLEREEQQLLKRAKREARSESMRRVESAYRATAVMSANSPGRRAITRDDACEATASVLGPLKSPGVATWWRDTKPPSAASDGDGRQEGSCAPAHPVRERDTCSPGSLSQSVSPMPKTARTIFPMTSDVSPSVPHLNEREGSVELTSGTAAVGSKAGEPVQMDAKRMTGARAKKSTAARSTKASRARERGSLPPSRMHTAHTASSHSRHATQMSPAASAGAAGEAPSPQLSSQGGLAPGLTSGGRESVATLTDGVRRALGLLKDVRDRLMRSPHRGATADRTGTVAASVAPMQESRRPSTAEKISGASSGRPGHRFSPSNRGINTSDNVSILEAYMRRMNHGASGRDASDADGASGHSRSPPHQTVGRRGTAVHDVDGASSDSDRELFDETKARRPKGTYRNVPNNLSPSSKAPRRMESLRAGRTSPPPSVYSELPLGIAARRRLEGTAMRESADRALWLMSLSPTPVSERTVGGGSRSRRARR